MELKQLELRKELFDLIRCEKVILFIGAGASIEAGMPAGSDLKKIILSKLTKDELKKIDSNQSLQKLTEEIQQLKSRGFLIGILKNVYSDKNIKSTKWHEQLGIISHFKTIITTNYDNLIELGLDLKDKAIIKSNQVSTLNENWRNIFKIHGDLSFPESIILCESDYTNFFIENNEEDVFWTVIRERMITNTTLFIGYSLDDSNIEVIFNKISKNLKGNRNPSFLVTRSMKDHRIKHLENKGVGVIIDSAQNFLADLIKVLRENIFEDFHNKKVSPETMHYFLSNHNLNSQYESKNDSLSIRSIQDKSGITEAKAFFVFNNGDPKESEFKEFIDGNLQQKLELSSDHLSDLNFSVNKIELIKLHKGAKIIFQRIIKNYSIDIRFDNGEEFNDLIIKPIGDGKKAELSLFLKNGILKIDMNISGLSGNYMPEFTHNDQCGNSKEEIETFKFMLYLSTGMNFKVYYKNEKVFSNSFILLQEWVDQFNLYLTYFNRLKLIENHIGYKFKGYNFIDITQENYRLVNEAVNAINNKPLECTFNSDIVINRNLSKKLFDLYKQAYDKKQSMGIDYGRIDLNLHGKKIPLGYKKIEFIDPQFEIINTKKEKILKVKNLKGLIHYTKEP